MSMESLRDVMVDGLKDLYSAENMLIKALPKMAKAATSKELQKAFSDHLKETQGHVDRLEKIFEQLEGSPKGKSCKAMKGLIEEGDEVIKAKGEDAARDAALIVAAQKVEHYEMAGYGSLRTFATVLGETAIAEILQETLDEEGAADHKLTEIAESGLNSEAAEGDDMSNEEDEEGVAMAGARNSNSKRGN